MGEGIPKIFISYSHKDEVLKDRLKKHLDIQVRNNTITVWDDRDIKLGDYWNDEIENAIKNADIAILLVSVHFLTSDFIMNNEIVAIEKQGLKISPIILSPCDWGSCPVIDVRQGFPKDNIPLSIRPDADIEVQLDLFAKTIANQSTKDSYTSSATESDEEQMISEVITLLMKKNASENMMKTVLKYFPEKYKDPIPTSIEEMVRLLVRYEEKNNRIPLICVLEKLSEDLAYPVELKNYLKYLIHNKYKGVEYQCIENEFHPEYSFLIEFQQEEHDRYSINIWKYFNHQLVRSDLNLPGSIIFTDENIKSFFNMLSEQLNSDQFRDVDIFLEFILPIEEMTKGIKHWKYTVNRGKRTKDKSIVGKYKHVLRIQERFRNFNVGWINKWENIKDEESIIDNKHKMLTSKYNDDISELYTCVLGETQTENLEDVLYDIDESNIPIAILPLSKNINTEDYRYLYKTKVKECKQVINEFILEHFTDDNSNMIFLFDDPNKVPREIKQDNNFKYSYD